MKIGRDVAIVSFGRESRTHCRTGRLTVSTNVMIRVQEGESLHPLSRKVGPGRRFVAFSRDWDTFLNATPVTVLIRRIRPFSLGRTIDAIFERPTSISRTIPGARGRADRRHCNLARSGRQAAAVQDL